MDVYLSFNNGAEQIRLPVLPSNFTILAANTNTVVNINSIGDINLIGKTGLNEITIESFFPAQEYNFCQYVGFNAPKYYVSLIGKWQQSSKPIRLIITGTPINYAMAIESFNITEQDGTGDIYFSLALKEYKFIKSTTNNTTTTTHGNTVNKPSTTREIKDIGTQYTVQKGDTLWSIAKRFTGTGSNYSALAKANNIIDPDKIYVGQVLTI